MKLKICLSSDLRGEPRAKDKEKDLILCVGELFRRGLIYAPNDWPGGLLWSLPGFRLKLTDGLVYPIPPPGFNGRVSILRSERAAESELKGRSNS